MLKQEELDSFSIKTTEDFFCFKLLDDLDKECY